MATGVVASVNADGFGSIAPDSRGEPLYFWVEYPNELMIGDRVRFVGRMGQHGPVAERVQRDEGAG